MPPREGEGLLKFKSTNSKAKQTNKKLDYMKTKMFCSNKDIMGTLWFPHPDRSMYLCNNIINKLIIILHLKKEKRSIMFILCSAKGIDGIKMVLKFNIR